MELTVNQFSIQSLAFLLFLFIGVSPSPMTGFTVKLYDSLNAVCLYDCKPISVQEDSCSRVENGPYVWSLETFGNCAIVWDSYGCKGNSFQFDNSIERNLSSLCTQMDLTKCAHPAEGNWSKKIRAVSGCNFRKSKSDSDVKNSTTPCQETQNEAPVVVNCPVGSWATGIRAEAEDGIVLECFEAASGNTTRVYVKAGTVVGITGAVLVGPNFNTRIGY